MIRKKDLLKRIEELESIAFKIELKAFDNTSHIGLVKILKELMGEIYEHQKCVEALESYLGIEKVSEPEKTYYRKVKKIKWNQAQKHIVSMIGTQR